VPAAAVIPAPIAYIKVVAVKTLVVEFWVRVIGQSLRLYWLLDPFSWDTSSLGFQGFTLKKLKCLRQACA
jgi:hypothetical protein